MPNYSTLYIIIIIKVPTPLDARYLEYYKMFMIFIFVLIIFVI